MFAPQTNFIGRWIGAAIASSLTSLGLFWLMYSVIHVSGHGINKIENLPTVDFVRLKHDVEPQTLERKKPPPPPPAKQPPPPAKMQVDVQAAAPGAGISVPTNLGLSANVGGGVGGGPGIGASMDSDLIPLQRMLPQYPADARRGGITGYVQIDVTINADGSVRTARVVEAKPKGIFEAAAITAIQKWRFKPKVVEGKAVEFHGVQKIEFNLNGKA
ncbi:MAG: tonB [Nevskia sp.]|nr:tonB [Nevskia sp.]